MAVDSHGYWYSTRAAAGVRCFYCRRVFARYAAPAPDPEGRRVCRDCRDQEIALLVVRDGD